jgi:hypothetical protein
MMPYFLYSASEERQVSELFTTEIEMWVHVRSQDLCTEVVDRDDMVPRRVLHPGYEIHSCDVNGRRIGDLIIRQWPFGR